MSLLCAEGLSLSSKNLKSSFKVLEIGQKWQLYTFFFTKAIFQQILVNSNRIYRHGIANKSFYGNDLRVLHINYLVRTRSDMPGCSKFRFFLLIFKFLKMPCCLLCEQRLLKQQQQQERSLKWGSTLDCLDFIDLDFSS